MINFHEIHYTGNELKYIDEAMHKEQLHGNGFFSKKVCQSIQEKISGKAMLLPSCTSALEMSALLIDVGVKDEIIMPSYTFVSTANAFALRGGKIKFVDVDPQSMNISIKEILNAITDQTKAVVVVNYGGFSIDFDRLLPVLKEKRIYLIEDNAQGIGASYKGRPLGSIGDFSCISFHDTKNITSGGEGGALIINNDEFIDKARMVQEKGTNRYDFMNDTVDFYSWQRLGSSFLMSEINAAFLWAQLEKLETINAYRRQIWVLYYESLETLEEKNLLIRQKKCPYNLSNGHLFFIKLENEALLKKLKSYLKKKKIITNTHYVPLHNSNAGKIYSEFIGEDHYTTKESKKLLRLPLHNNLTLDDVRSVITEMKVFIEEHLYE